MSAEPNACVSPRAKLPVRLSNSGVSTACISFLVAAPNSADPEHRRLPALRGVGTQNVPFRVTSGGHFGDQVADHIGSGAAATGVPR